MNKTSRAVVWSLYDDIKREVMDYHMRLLTSFNEYRTAKKKNYHSGMQAAYFDIGNSLRKLVHICFTSGAWEKYSDTKKTEKKEVYEEIRSMARSWLERSFKHEDIMKDITWLEDAMEDLFEETHFYDITADTGESRSINIEEFFQESGM